MHVNQPSVHSEMREAKPTGYRNRGLEFGGQQGHGRYGTLVRILSISLIKLLKIYGI